MRQQTDQDTPFEFFGEGHLVQENPRVPELVIEPVLDSPNALDRTVHITVPCQHYHCGVGFPEVQGLACVEVRRNVVLFGDIFMGFGGEFAFEVRD